MLSGGKENCCKYCLVCTSCGDSNKRYYCRFGYTNAEETSKTLGGKFGKGAKQIGSGMKKAGSGAKKVLKGAGSLGKMPEISLPAGCSTDIASGAGKQLFMIPRPIRSCQDSNTGWARPVVTRAWVCTWCVLVFSTMFVEPSTDIFPPLALNRLMLLFLLTWRLSCCT